MGKNYDAYVQANEANNQAMQRVQEVNGGATAEAIQEARVNALQTQAAVDYAWNKVMQDPQG